MSKNYFTNAQVQELIGKIKCITHNQDSEMAMGETLFTSNEDIKSLLNLAVEAAIGEPVATHWMPLPLPPKDKP